VGTAIDLYDRNLLYLRLAREIAIDLHELDDILTRHDVKPAQFNKIKEDPYFVQLLTAEVQAWNSAKNTHERTKLKAAALMEEWLSEANTRIYDPQETLPSKVELAKLLSRLAGMGNERAEGGPAGDRFSVTINLGDDSRLKVIDAQVIPTIEHNSGRD
jgi:hypothetical protein